MQNLNELDNEQLLIDEDYEDLKVKVIGVGGGGGNLVNGMYKNAVPGVDYVVVNTDRQALRHSPFKQIQIGKNCCKGFGAGTDPNKGRQAALEQIDELDAELEGVKLLYIVAGLGGGTGTGAAPVIAERAVKKGILTIAVVTMPFSFEQEDRRVVARKGLETLKSTGVDAYIVIQNDRCCENSNNESILFADALQMANAVLHEAIQGLMLVIMKHGTINVDFSDIEVILKGGGETRIGVGRSSSAYNRSLEAMVAAVNSPLIDGSIAGAQRVVLVCRSSNITTNEVNFINRQIETEVQKRVKRKIKCVFGTINDPSMGNELELILIATRFQTLEEFSDGVKSSETPDYLNESVEYGVTEDLFGLGNEPEYTEEPAAAVQPEPEYEEASVQEEEYVEEEVQPIEKEPVRPIYSLDDDDDDEDDDFDFVEVEPDIPTGRSGRPGLSGIIGKAKKR